MSAAEEKRERAIKILVAVVSDVAAAMEKSAKQSAEVAALLRGLVEHYQRDTDPSQLLASLSSSATRAGEACMSLLETMKVFRGALAAIRQ